MKDLLIEKIEFNAFCSFTPLSAFAENLTDAILIYTHNSVIVVLNMFPQEKKLT